MVDVNDPPESSSPHAAGRPHHPYHHPHALGARARDAAALTALTVPAPRPPDSLVLERFERMTFDEHAAGKAPLGHRSGVAAVWRPLS